ncbi:MAG TPA: NrfD/PsrC family molybdoenzyme membrane anchor subunit [Acidobacteriota bacterium]|nr:NrfD/PsrC family molybdoenzyme membrane anchor subunit [Acidobacteriota bacterium]
MDFVFPNEANVTWTVMIVLYPFITGLVAGAFIVSSLFHVFGRENLKAVARYSLVSAFVFLIFAPLPLLVHLGHPERAFNIMITPNFSSAMAGFGFIYTAYLLLVLLEIWFSLRSEFIARAKGKGLAAWICRLILLYNLEEDESTKRTDHKITRFLAGLGIPLACLLHGYVGFLFGALKANPWWSTPLMFVIFIFSAIVSGIAVIIFHYFVVSWINGWKIDQVCVRTLAKYLWGFMIVAVALELLEILSLAYKQTEEWEVLRTLIDQKLFFSYIIFQFLILSLIPFLMLAVASLVKLKDRLAYALIWTASTMLLFQVLLMRWNVVIGGQLLSKSLRGFTNYFPGIWDREGLIVAAIIFTLPFGILYVFHRIIPLFPGAVKVRGRNDDQVTDTTAGSGT